MALGGGCTTASYLLEQGAGQLRIFHRRQHVDALLRRRHLPPGWRSRLELLRSARTYAFDVIGLARTAAYTHVYDTGGKPIAYNLSAAPKDALTPRLWRFPIVGALPYLGFYQRDKGLARQRELDRRGFDTYLRPVSAYSSLGWFADPVYSSMLEARPSRLVELVIHESTHTTIFLRGQVGFNESLAVFVGQQGTINFLARRHGPLSPRVERALATFRRRQRFGRLVSELYRRLRRLYRSPRSQASKLRQREHLFAWAKARHRQLFPELPRARFVREPLNNAIVLSLGRYLTGVAFHRAVYDCLGRDLGALVAFYRRAQRHDDPLSWAARRCRLRGPRPQPM